MGQRCRVNVYTQFPLLNRAAVDHAIKCAAARLVRARSETRDTRAFMRDHAFGV